MTETAYDRLATIAQNNELGAGMAVAMKDLEIRGAGNVLGVEQSGHVAAVGFELYVELLNEIEHAHRVAHLAPPETPGHPPRGALERRDQDRSAIGRDRVRVVAAACVAAAGPGHTVTATHALLMRGNALPRHS